MRVPRINTTNVTELQEETKNINFFVKPSMYVELTELVEDEKKREKFIKQVERAVRGSLEYREYTNFLKEEINMNSCLFYNEIDRNEMQNVRLEIHHDPFTLYDICEIVIMKRINDGESIAPLNVAEEVMKLHFMGLVGLVPLSLTVHQLVHSGHLFVPVNKIFGNLKEFVTRYKSGMSSEHFDLLNKAIEITQQMENEDYNPSVLERKAIYLKVRGQDKVKEIDNTEMKFA